MFQERRLAAVIAYISNRLGLVDAYSLLRKQITKSQVIVLTYHRVGNPTEFPWNFPLVTMQNFENQIKYLRKTYNIISLNTLVNHIRDREPMSGKSVVITFDDGYRNNFTHAYPVLKRYSIPATINLVTAHIGTGNLFWWDKIKYVLWNTKLKKIDLGEFGEHRLQSINDRVRLASNINQKLKIKPEKEKNLIIKKTIHVSGVHIPANLGKELILSWDDIMEMNNNDITFGAHSLTHPNLAKLPTEQARHEITCSKRSIEERIGREVTVFCYPNGDFNTEIIKLVNDAGFYCAFTTTPRIVDSKTSFYELGRISGGWNLDTLKLFSCGAYSDLNTMLLRMRGKYN